MEAETTLEEVVAPQPLVHQLVPLMTNKGNRLATSNSTPRAQACITPFTLSELGLPTVLARLKEHQDLVDRLILVTQPEAITTRDPHLPTEQRVATITTSTTAVLQAIRHIQVHPRGRHLEIRALEVDLGRLRASLVPPDRGQGLQGSRMQPQLYLGRRLLREVGTSWRSWRKEGQPIRGLLQRHRTTPCRRVLTAQPGQRTTGNNLTMAPGFKFPRPCPAKSRKIPISSSSKCRHYSLERTLPL